MLSTRSTHPPTLGQIRRRHAKRRSGAAARPSGQRRQSGAAAKGASQTQRPDPAIREARVRGRRPSAFWKSALSNGLSMHPRPPYSVWYEICDGFDEISPRNALFWTLFKILSESDMSKDTTDAQSCSKFSGFRPYPIQSHMLSNVRLRTFRARPLPCPAQVKADNLSISCANFFQIEQISCEQPVKPTIIRQIFTKKQSVTLMA